MTTTPHQATSILRMDEVIAKVGVSKTEIYRRIKANTFPAAVKLGIRARGWKREDIDAWINALASVGK